VFWWQAQFSTPSGCALDCGKTSPPPKNLVGKPPLFALVTKLLWSVSLWETQRVGAAVLPSVAVHIQANRESPLCSYRRPLLAAWQFAQQHTKMASNGKLSNEDVGILAMEVYFPSTYVKQTDMEAANGVSAGKYTIGLGQDAMAFTGDLEDVNSISLTVVQALLEKYNINPNEIGRMEIGTESLVDKSKSTKTVLMSLFAESGNTDIEGATVINACYGGTAALLNALSWVDSGAWDGRYAIVVAADIAVYADGPARPTGGVGSVAMLVGRNAPLRFDLRTRTTHATHVWDFFKPNLDSEYPEVNGALSQTCYLKALDDCYTRFVGKNKSIRGKEVSVGAADHFLFHAPYNKLVQKSFARLCFQDMLSGAMDGSSIEKWKSIPSADTYEDRGLEAALKSAAGPVYKSKVAPACEVSKKIGNTYTASVWINLANLVSHYGEALDGQSVVLFSYGSGALASMLGISPTSNTTTSDPRFSLSSMQSALDLPTRLSSREALTPADLTSALDAREASHGFIPFTPTFDSGKLYPGTFYLSFISPQYERLYTRRPLTEPRVVGGPLVVKSAPVDESVDDINMDEFGVGLNMDEFDPSVPMKSSLSGLASSSNASQMSPSFGSFARLTRSETEVWASGRPNVKVVVTGVSAALPGRDHDVFPPGVNNIQRIIEGESFISNLPTEVTHIPIPSYYTPYTYVMHQAAHSPSLYAICSMLQMLYILNPPSIYYNILLNPPTQPKIFY
jgi:hydroxymethylglutaryl-CoA synthase